MSPQNGSVLRFRATMKILTGDVDIEDVNAFLQTAVQLKSQGDKNNVDSVLQVSASANDDVYNEARRDSVMCQALRDLMADEIDYEVNKGIAKGRAEGRAEGKAEGFLAALYGLVKKGLLKPSDAAEQANMAIDAFLAGMQAQG